MRTIVAQLGLSGNPFEHYTAETEPHITEYAVRPPYLEAIAARLWGFHRLFYSAIEEQVRAQRASPCSINSGLNGRLERRVR